MAITDSLIAWWTLNEKSGTRIDWHGGNNLTDNNTVLFGGGKRSNAADFEADNSECLWIADNADLSFGNEDFTVAAWVKLEVKAGNMAIISKYDTPDNLREYQLYYDGTADRFRWLVSPAGSGAGAESILANTLGAPANGIWYFIVAWHDATANAIKIQVNNGVADSETANDGCNDNTSRFVIGASGAAGGFSNYFDGLIDEAAVWGRVLTADEKTELYNAGAGRAYGYWLAGPQPILVW